MIAFIIKTRNVAIYIHKSATKCKFVLNFFLSIKFFLHPNYSLGFDDANRTCCANFHTICNCNKYYTKCR